MAELLEMLQQPRKSPATNESREKSREVARSIRQTLAQATKLKDLTFQAAVDMASCESSSQEAMDLRAKAQAIIALTRSWAEACEIVRVVRGKPLPGSLRPESKPAKRKQQPLTFQEHKPAA